MSISIHKIGSLQLEKRGQTQFKSLLHPCLMAKTIYTPNRLLDIALASTLLVEFGFVMSENTPLLIG